MQEFLTHSRAYWVSKSLIAWNVDAVDGSCYLFASRTAALSAVDNGIHGGQSTSSASQSWGFTLLYI